MSPLVFRELKNLWAAQNKFILQDHPAQSSSVVRGGEERLEVAHGLPFAPLSILATLGLGVDGILLLHAAGELEREVGEAEAGGARPGPSCFEKHPSSSSLFFFRCVPSLASPRTAQDRPQPPAQPAHNPPTNRPQPPRTPHKKSPLRRAGPAPSFLPAPLRIMQFLLNPRRERVGRREEGGGSRTPREGSASAWASTACVWRGGGLRARPA